MANSDPSPSFISRAVQSAKVFGRSIVDLSPWFIILIIGAILILIARDAPVIAKLSDPAFARGLITFIITVATIGLAFLLVYEAFNTASDDKADERFRRGREVFTVLMGVLGTIVGFYFGSAEKPATALQIAPIKFTAKQLETHVAGGISPYQYLIMSTDTNFHNIERTSDDGWIVESLQELPKPGSTIEVSVTDSKQQKETRKTGIPPELNSETTRSSAKLEQTNVPPTPDLIKK